jgi:hypothetical protein
LSSLHELRCSAWRRGMCGGADEDVADDSDDGDDDGC